MSDTAVVKQTDPTAKGTSTSEFKFAMIVAVASGFIGTLESVVAIVKDAYPTAWWVPMLGGFVGMVGAAFAYLKSRSTVKVAMLQMGTTVALAQSRPTVTTNP